MKFITVQSNNIRNQENKGFTLIELIIVIGVLGVLAAALLVAIDPLEQLARGRDSGRLSSVTQLGRAFQAYAAGQNLSAFPAGSVTWQDTLVNSGDVKAAIIVNPDAKTHCEPAAALAEGNICYKPLTKTVANDDAAIWIGADSKSYRSKVPVASCAAAAFPVAIYIMSQGKAGVTCLTDNAVANQPTSATVLY
jgi:prepilin-type N-terminal cleavage/methylation domain-containing protein